MRIKVTIQEKIELRKLYEQIKSMPVGSILSLNGVTYSRRSLATHATAMWGKKGGFVSPKEYGISGTADERKYSMAKWIEVYLMNTNQKRLVVELLRSQIILGLDAISAYSWVYHNKRYKKRKAEMFDSIHQNEVAYGHVFPINGAAPNRSNMFKTGKSLASLFDVTAKYDGTTITFDYYQSLFATKMRLGKEGAVLGSTFPKRQRGLALNKEAMDFFIKEILITFVKNLGGEITDYDKYR